MLLGLTLPGGEKKGSSVVCRIWPLDYKNKENQRTQKGRARAAGSMLLVSQPFVITFTNSLIFFLTLSLHVELVDTGDSVVQCVV